MLKGPALIFLVLHISIFQDRPERGAYDKFKKSSKICLKISSTDFFISKKNLMSIKLVFYMVPSVGLFSGHFHGLY